MRTEPITARVVLQKGETQYVSVGPGMEVMIVATMMTVPTVNILNPKAMHPKIPSWKNFNERSLTTTATTPGRKGRSVTRIRRKTVLAGDHLPQRKETRHEINPSLQKRGGRVLPTMLGQTRVTGPGYYRSTRNQRSNFEACPLSHSLKPGSSTPSTP